MVSVAKAKAAVGSRRYRITVKGPGGHSYGAFGLSNPVHALGQVAAEGVPLGDSLQPAVARQKPRCLNRHVERERTAVGARLEVVEELLRLVDRAVGSDAPVDDRGGRRGGREVGRSCAR